MAAFPFHKWGNECMGKINFLSVSEETSEESGFDP